MRRATSAIVIGMIAVLAACSSGSKHNNTSPSTASTSSTISGTVIGTIPDTAWHSAASGEFRAKPWTVWVARSKNDWLCYTRETTSSGATTTTTTAPANGSPNHRGNPATCLAPAGHTPPAGFTALVAGPDGKSWVVVGAVPDGVKKVSIAFADGSTTKLGVDQRTRLVEWKGPASLRPARVLTDARSCGLDAAQLKHGEKLCAGVAA